jgi:beta-galactosidase GanA
LSERWQDYVEEGGKLLLITRAGAKEPSNVWSEQPQPYLMSKWLGLRVDENLSFPPYLPGTPPSGRLGDIPATNEVPIALYEELLGRQLTARRLWAERLDPSAGEDILLRYSKATETDFFAELVAMTRHKLGKGEGYYLGVLPNEDTYTYLWEELFGDICQPIAANLPRIAGFEVIRTGEQGNYLALLNHNSHSLEVNLGATYRQQDGTVVDLVVLPPFGVMFLAI